MAKKDFHDRKPLVTIESVIPLDVNSITEVLLNLKLDADQIEVRNTKNPGLIGGLRISYQGKVIDMSINHKLDQLKTLD